jgi:hypothetical protein
MSDGATNSLVISARRRRHVSTSAELERQSDRTASACLCSSSASKRSAAMRACATLRSPTLTEPSPNARGNGYSRSLCGLRSVGTGRDQRDALTARAATPSGLSQSALASCQHRIAIAASAPAVAPQIERPVIPRRSANPRLRAASRSRRPSGYADPQPRTPRAECESRRRRSRSGRQSCASPCKDRETRPRPASARAICFARLHGIAM